MTRPWKRGTWMWQIVEGGSKRGQEVFSQSVFQPKMGEDPARRQDVSFIPEREKQKGRRIESEEGELSSSQGDPGSSNVHDD